MATLLRMATATVLLLAAGSAAALDAQAERGRAVIAAHGCAACHLIPGIRGAQGRVGPPLTRMGRRVYIAGLLPNTRAAMVRWLRDPPAVDPTTAMPAVGLSEADAQAAAAYLSTLR